MSRLSQPDLRAVNQEVFFVDTHFISRTMSIPETPKASGAMDASNKLRLELKQWENAFAAANGGRKAGREDIKQHPEIGTKILRLACV